jgi:RNA polymerase sigma-70 factor (ECF subfamily)
MADASSLSVQIQGWIDQLHAGEESARKELINCACARMLRLTRKMLKDFPKLKRWEQTDDILQNASLRLYRTLGQIRPVSVAEFFRLAALNIRRELLDLAKHHYGPQGQGANHASVGDDSKGPSALEKQDSADEPSRLAAWAEFHRQAGQLPEEELEIFDLLWYQGLSQSEAGALLKVSERTVKRRWQSARLKLHDATHGELPG